MAEVYLAVARGPAGFNKLVVLKRLLPGLAAEPNFLDMFLDEARLAGQLNHPNVVQTNEVGFDADRYFIAMEYLDGQPLVRILHRALPSGLPMAMILRIIADACAGLQYAHTLTDFNGVPLGIVHRDVSPHNLFVTYGGHVKVVDFGIAKAASRTTDTQTGVLKGKIAYMSPEQLGEQEIDGRSDLFSLGIVLYEAVTRQRLWGVRPRDVEILKRLVAGEVPTSPRAILPSVPDEVDRICRRALALRREERYASALEMQKDLEECISRLSQRPSEREVGDVVTRLFAEDRRTIANTIEKQLRELDVRQSGAFALRSLPSLNGSGVMSLTSSKQSILKRSGDRPKIVPTHRRLLVGAGTAVVLAAVATWAAVPGHKPERRAEAPAPPLWAVPAAAVVATPASTEAEPVRAPEPSAEPAADTSSGYRATPTAVSAYVPRRGGGMVGAVSSRPASPATPAAAAQPLATTTSTPPTPTYGPLDGRH
jgi:serine/threonine-protein kinase